MGDNKEYCVMHERHSVTEPHYGPVATRKAAQQWIDEAELMGFKEGVFKIYSRTKTPWRAE